MGLRCPYKKFRGKNNRKMIKYHNEKTPKTVWCISYEETANGDIKVFQIELEKILASVDTITKSTKRNDKPTDTKVKQHFSTNKDIRNIKKLWKIKGKEMWKDLKERQGFIHLRNYILENMN